MTKSANKQETYEELKDRIAQLESLINQLVSSPVKKNEDTSVKLEDYIQVMSLTGDKLNLSTEGFGRGKRYSFTKFGEVKRIIYKDIVDIIENQQHFLNKGLFVLLDERVIRLHGLDDLYSTILTKDKIEQIIFNNGNQQDLVELYRSANARQKEVINDMIIERIVRGDDVDLNMISQLGRIGKIDLIQKAEEAKEFATAMQ